MSCRERILVNAVKYDRKARVDVEIYSNPSGDVLIVGYEKGKYKTDEEMQQFVKDIIKSREYEFMIKYRGLTQKQWREAE